MSMPECAKINAETKAALPYCPFCGTQMARIKGDYEYECPNCKARGHMGNEGLFFISKKEYRRL
jgi:NADH pyrophosphatase NudC (nudix superfamily)